MFQSCLFYWCGLSDAGQMCSVWRLPIQNIDCCGLVSPVSAPAFMPWWIDKYCRLLLCKQTDAVLVECELVLGTPVVGAEHQRGDDKHGSNAIARHRAMMMPLLLSATVETLGAGRPAGHVTAEHGGCVWVCVCVRACVLLLYTVCLEWIWPRTGSIPESADLVCVYLDECLWRSQNKSLLQMPNAVFF